MRLLVDTSRPAKTYFFVVIFCSLSCNQAGKTTIPLYDSASQEEHTAVEVIDNDGDGFVQDEDCDDSNPLIHPQSIEICNGRDDNCNGEIDEGAGIDWFFDADEDGYGSEFLENSCDSIPGSSQFDGDCDDEDPLVYPNSLERIDGKDSNCDGATDWLVQIYVAVDDAGELCINNEVFGDTGTWTTGRAYEKWMTTGPVAIGVYGWDVGYAITAGIVHLEISNGDIWTSDSSWVFSPDPENESSKDGWCTPPFDDSSWESVQVIGPIGTSPWGNAPSVFPQASPAQWIWDYFPVELNSQYLRTVITLP